MENIGAENLFSLKNKIIIVTGGYGHLGKSIVKGLANCKANVIVFGRSKDKFDVVFNEPNIYFFKCDISSTENIKNGFKWVDDKYGKIDVLINNAIYSMGGRIDNMSDEAWGITIDGVLSSTHRCIREILPYFRKKNGGRIINVSSMYGMVAPDFNVYKDFPNYANPPHYGVGKAGIIQLSKYFASLLGKENILVNTVSPGSFPSDVVQESAGFIDVLSQKNPLGRIGRPDELQGVFVFLSSDSSSYITGQNIAIDGGWTII